MRISPGSGKWTSRVNSFGSRMRRSIFSRSMQMRSTKRALSLGCRALVAFAEAKLGRVSRKEQFERPVERHAQLSVEAGQAKQIVSPPKEPSDETGDHDTAGQLRNGFATAKRGHHAECLVAKRACRLSANRRHDIVGQFRSFADRVLCGHRIHAAVAIRNRSAITERPDTRKPGDAHVAFGPHRAALGSRQID